MSADVPAGYSESNKQEIKTTNIKSLRLGQTVMQLQPKSHVGVGYHLSQIRGQRLNTSCDPPRVAEYYISSANMDCCHEEPDGIR